MAQQSTYDDANLILRLYEIRREERMRKARAWFGKSYKARSMEEHLKLCPPGSDEDASFRMITSYWEMAASFVTSGVLNEDLFLQSGRELLFVWERIKDIVPAARQAYKSPNVHRHMETVANAFIASDNKHAPGAYEAFSARVRGA
jgi:hypothetical protein